ncbi:MAG: hypothetical protein HY587_08615 [Candidatus Omnitrophica bacterium]|nr:hypothetical protein [Candidatus Omnitrophota bacterium]
MPPSGSSKDSKRSGRQIKTEDQMKSDFVSTVSHELRTPLTALEEGLSLVLDGVSGEIDDEARKLLTIAKRNADRLKALINDLLDISKLEAGKMLLHRTACDVPTLVVGLMDTFQFLVRRKEICFKTEFEPDLPLALADKNRILQVLVNLVGNAVKFVPPKGHITVQMKLWDQEGPLGQYILVEVIDNGQGIPEDDLPRIFDKFHQVGRQIGPGLKGTGLGLSIARHIVELHKGKIWVKSKQCEGSTFMFTLPVYSQKLEFTENFTEYLEQAYHNKETVGCFLIELENFAVLAGRRSLREAHHTVDLIEKCLTDMLRSEDRILRFRELQLVAVIPRCAERELGEFENRAIATLNEKHFPWEVRMAVSAAVYPQDGRTWLSLLDFLEDHSRTVIGKEIRIDRIGNSPKH